ncbi:hypothetical protein C8R30_1192 [Nitrosomonas nitrosa]|jgi:hypothetical protein|uniref:Uncharacterized protein n=1 Tax=Nitrosomonas nitrosa TaxID=52442 RepID=A0A1I4NLP6_9PROT|nr:hypothetical protein [Nitrosomonas nitrosa]PTQ93373.1 hypothetical protein C8R30_1192 [Nitrosomonas nitrosa]SFM16217.1 hypothetical protein SAMN05421880_10849 [Nitrosomonas nitrosa]
MEFNQHVSGNAEALVPFQSSTTHHDSNKTSRIPLFGTIILIVFAGFAGFFSSLCRKSTRTRE